MTYNLGTVAQASAIIGLTALASLAAGNPAAAFPLSQYVTADSLKAHCDAAGGTFSQYGNLSGCSTDVGSVSCDSKTKKCTGSTASDPIKSKPRFLGLPPSTNAVSTASLTGSSASSHATEVHGGTSVNATSQISVH